MTYRFGACAGGGLTPCDRAEALRRLRDHDDKYGGPWTVHVLRDGHEVGVSWNGRSFSVALASLGGRLTATEMDTAEGVLGYAETTRITRIER